MGVAAALTIDTIQNQTTTTTTTGQFDRVGIAIGAALAIGLPGLGAGISNFCSW
jgi:hypothetical protein